MEPQNILDAYRWRYATKKFNASRKIPDATWAQLEEALRLTPSSFGLQLWKFLVIDDPKLRAALKPHTWNQSQVTDCSHFVVFTHKTEPSQSDIDALIGEIAAARKADAGTLDGYKNMMSGFVLDKTKQASVAQWTAHQAYIALGFLMSACAMLRIDTCPMEGFERDKYNEILDLPRQGLSAVVLCAAGYRADDDAYQSAPKVRFPVGTVIKHL